MWSFAQNGTGRDLVLAVLWGRVYTSNTSDTCINSSTHQARELGLAFHAGFSSLHDMAEDLDGHLPAN